MTTILTTIPLVDKLLKSIKTKDSINMVCVVDDPVCDKHELIVEDHQERGEAAGLDGVGHRAEAIEQHGRPAEVRAGGGLGGHGVVGGSRLGGLWHVCFFPEVFPVASD